MDGIEKERQKERDGHPDKQTHRNEMHRDPSPNKGETASRHLETDRQRRRQTREETRTASADHSFTQLLEYEITSLRKSLPPVSPTL